ncbi:TolC family protein [Gemmatimonas phototrophica]|uniref:TolC family protein n=1 Tax=Gemmatimonas phototrophica TaxID=1379270 RepID=UPI001314A0D0|nr:TolC family protein [Gemmatimonas phototrophica]
MHLFRPSCRRLRRPLPRAVLAAALAPVFGACAHGSLQRDVSAVDDLLRERAGVVVPSRSEFGAAIGADTVAKLLAAPLTPETAVRIALISHPALRATYAELGLARADVVQAALVANPVVTLERFTAGRFQEFGIAQSFIDLLSLPMRRRVAEAQLTGARLRVADQVFQQVVEVRHSLVEAVAAAQIREIRDRAQAAAAASATAATAIHAAGNLKDLDLVNERAAASEFQAGAIEARGESQSSRERLVRALGVSTTGAALVLPERLPDLPANDPTEDTLVALAARSRLDLAAALQDVNAAGKALGLTNRFRLLPDGTLSFAGEGEDGGPFESGPGFSIPLPFFDRGQARMLRAQSALRAATARHEALTLSMRADVRAAHALLTAARERFDEYRSRVVPLRRRVTEEAQLQYNAMAVSVFGLLQARQGELNAGQGYIEALSDYWKARIQLERAVGTSLP